MRAKEEATAMETLVYCYRTQLYMCSRKDYLDRNNHANAFSEVDHSKTCCKTGLITRYTCYFTCYTLIVLKVPRVNNKPKWELSSDWLTNLKLLLLVMQYSEQNVLFSNFIFKNLKKLFCFASAFPFYLDRIRREATRWKPEPIKRQCYLASFASLS